MRTTAIQFEIMVEFMERHGDLTKPQSGSAGRQEAQQKWLELVEALNADMTGEFRNVEKWKKVWSDLKTNTKRKAAKIYRAAADTNGGPTCQLVLSDLEQRVLNLVGNGSATGLLDVMEVGVELVIAADSTPPLKQAHPSGSSTSPTQVPIQSFVKPSPPECSSPARPRSASRSPHPWRSAGPSRSPRSPRGARSPRSPHSRRMPRRPRSPLNDRRHTTSRRSSSHTTRTQALADAFSASDRMWQEQMRDFRELYSQRTEVLRNLADAMAEGVALTSRHLDHATQALELRVRELERKVQGQQEH